MASMLLMYESAARRRIDDTEVIVEFGAGYGLMCNALMTNLRFSGLYIIFDTPVMNALQRYFLESNGVRVYASVDSFRRVQSSTTTGVGWGGDVESMSGVVLVSTMADLKQIVALAAVDNWDTGLLRGRRRRATTFIAHWSLSEAPTELRNAVLQLVKGFDHFFMAYQDHDSSRIGNTRGNRLWFNFNFRDTVEGTLRSEEGGSKRLASGGGLEDLFVWTDFRHPFERCAYCVTFLKRIRKGGASTHHESTHYYHGISHPH